VMRVNKMIQLPQGVPKIMSLSVLSAAVFSVLLSFSAWSQSLVIEITQGVDNPVPIAVVPFLLSGLAIFGN
jgi:hypothetical protein